VANFAEIIRLREVKIALASLVAMLAVAAPANAGVVGYWPMIERSGQVVHDFSGNRNNGVLGTSKAVEASDPTWLRGTLLGGLHFAGGQEVTIPDSPSLDPQQVTVFALVRGSASPGTWRYVVSKGAMGCTAGSYGLYTGFGGGLAFYVFDGQNFFGSPEAPPTIWDGKWHVVAGTFDGTTVRLFVDGSQVGEGTSVPSPFAIAYDLPIGTGEFGAFGGCDLSFVGDITQVSIWNTALPIGDIFSRTGARIGSFLR
jgi:hypothetical protein